MRKTLNILCYFLICQAIFPIYFKHVGMGDGLSQPSVMSIYQDRLGRMWFGTREGISIYDGERMTVYKAATNEEERNTSNFLFGNECDFITGNKEGDVFFRNDWALIRYDIREQKFREVRTDLIRTITNVNGEIWCTANDSIFAYDSSGDSLRFVLKTGLRDMSALLVTDEKIWIGTTSGLSVLTKGEDKPRNLLSGTDIYRIFKSSTQEVWVGSRMNGLYCYSPDGKVRHYREDGDNPIVSNQIREFAEDKYGNIWFGTFRGLHKYNPYTDEFTLYQRDQLPGSLSHSSVFGVYMDRQGTIWAGTYYGGVNYFNPESDIFAHYIDNPTRNDCLNYPFVGHMAEDKEGNIWICTEGGGLNFMDRKTRTFRYFTSGPGNALAHNNVKSICYDSKREALFLGTHTGGLSRYDIKSNTFHNYLNEDVINRPNNVIMQTIIHDDKLYVAARNGVFSLDLETNEFKPFAGICQDLVVDSKGYVWLISTHTIIRRKLDNPTEQKYFLLPDYNIRFAASRIIESKQGVFLGTYGSGLYRYNEEKDDFIAYTSAEGHLLSNFCYDIAETNLGELVITSDKGVTFFNPQTEESRFVHLGSTLPITSITQGCGILICRNNEMFVGGTDGLTSFWPEDLDTREKEYSLYFSDLYIHNEKVSPFDQTKALDKALPFMNSLQLKYNQNNLIIEFASNDYIDIQQNNTYEYRLVGFDTEWLPTRLTSIYYTNLNPGTYELQVREKGLPTYSPRRQGISLGIVIAKPWYNTFWAWLCYTLIVATILYFIIRTKNARRQLALSLEWERQEKLRNEELNQAKLRFFTNISHEFRTPLTLIISQIDLLFQNSNLSPTVYNRIIKISKNANRMRNMITELLEFRKLEQNYVSLRVSEQNLVPFLKDIHLSFYEMAMQQGITLLFQSEEEEIPLWFDTHQLQKVFYNLLANALKYTQSGGTIEMSVSLTEEMVCVKILDTGIGLATEDAEHVFDRFYQAENGMKAAPSTPGTGIGLALTKTIINMHHGDVTVQSQLHYGTIFTVCLLRGKEHFENDSHIILLDAPEEPTIESGSLPETVSVEEYEELARIFPGIEEGTRYTVLIVEDNEELLQILETLFSPLYKVFLARNGEEGLQLAQAEKPDLIVSDVMMPVMTGTEMCMKIKNNIDLCHIPVVLLTALNTVEHNIEGLQQGADDYIGKPFHAKVLLMRCNNLIRNRLLMQNKLNKQIDFDVQLLAANPLDKKLIDRVSEIMEKYMEDPAFDVNRLATELAMGRSSLFTKFKALTGMTPNDYIQSQRLKRAATLLREFPDKQISEISDQLGFSSTVYFSRCFKAQFGASPAHFRKQK